jgi:iron complex outermembrane receptor protein
MLACVAAHAQVTLPPVVVTATRFADDVDRLPFGVSVVTAQQIRDAGVTTVNEALMKLLGVPGRQDLYGGGDYALDLRGFGSTSDSNQVVILDGMRLNEGDIGGTRLAGISIDSVESIEVIRGNAAVLYGEGATAGAIVINTKAASGKARKSSGYGYLGMGSNALLDARSGATLAQGGFSLDASIAGRATDGHRQNFRSSTEGHDLTGQWRNEWLRIGARHSQDELDTGLPGALTASQYEADPSQASSLTDHARIENLRNGLFANATIGNWQIGLDVGRRKKLLDSPGFSYNIEARNQSFKVRRSAPVGDFINTVTAGLDRNEWTRVVAGAFGGTAEQESKAFYLKNDLLLPSGTLLSVGGRRESVVKTLNTAPTAGIDQSINAWEFGVVQPIGRSTSVYAHAGRSFRFPNADEFSFTASPLTTLVPQTSRDVDLGVRMGWAGGRGDLRFYRNALRNEIGYDPSVGLFGANVNFDPTLRQGFELELQHALSRDVRVRANTAARQARFTEGPHDGKKVPLTPRYTASVGLDWQPLAGHTLAPHLNAVSSQSPDFENACTMPAYATAGLRYAYNTPNVELAVGVNNLTDKKYYTQAFRCAGGVTEAIYPEAGRTVVLSVRVTL